MSQGLLDKIKDIEFEISRTQVNKATMHHLCLLRAKRARYLSQLLEPPKGKGGPGEGFDVMKSGDARVAMIGFPSVGETRRIARCFAELCRCRQIVAAVDSHSYAVRSSCVRIHDADLHVSVLCSLSVPLMVCAAVRE